MQEITLDSGFSSPAVFSRAMKNYFGYSPEQLRALPHQEKMRLLHGAAFSSTVPHPTTTSIPANLAIQVVRKAPMKGIYILTSFDQTKGIQQAFQALGRFANANGYDTTGLAGIPAPHQRNTYKAFLPIPADRPAPASFCTTEIPGGTYAAFLIKGDRRQTNKTLHYFLRRWLPESGYKIAGIVGFETFAGDPASTPYLDLPRQLHIPIEPAQ